MQAIRSLLVTSLLCLANSSAAQASLFDRVILKELGCAAFASGFSGTVTLNGGCTLEVVGAATAGPMLLVMSPFHSGGCTLVPGFGCTATGQDSRTNLNLSWPILSICGAKCTIPLGSARVGQQATMQFVYGSAGCTGFGRGYDIEFRKGLLPPWGGTQSTPGSERTAHGDPLGVELFKINLNSPAYLQLIRPAQIANLYWQASTGKTSLSNPDLRIAPKLLPRLLQLANLVQAELGHINARLRVTSAWRDHTNPQWAGNSFHHMGKSVDLTLWDPTARNGQGDTVHNIKPCGKLWFGELAALADRAKFQWVLNEQARNHVHASHSTGEPDIKRFGLKRLWAQNGRERMTFVVQANDADLISEVFLATFKKGAVLDPRDPKNKAGVVHLAFQAKPPLPASIDREIEMVIPAGHIDPLTKTVKVHCWVVDTFGTTTRDVCEITPPSFESNVNWSGRAGPISGKDVFKVRPWISDNRSSRVFDPVTASHARADVGWANNFDPRNNDPDELRFFCSDVELWSPGAPTSGTVGTSGLKFVIFSDCAGIGKVDFTLESDRFVAPSSGAISGSVEFLGKSLVATPINMGVRHSVSVPLIVGRNEFPVKVGINCTAFGTLTTSTSAQLELLVSVHGITLN